MLRLAELNGKTPEYKSFTGDCYLLNVLDSEEADDLLASWFVRADEDEEPPRSFIGTGATYETHRVLSHKLGHVLTNGTTDAYGASYLEAEFQYNYPSRPAPLPDTILDGMLRSPLEGALNVRVGRTELNDARIERAFPSTPPDHPERRLPGNTVPRSWVSP